MRLTDLLSIAILSLSFLSFAIPKYFHIRIDSINRQISTFLISANVSLIRFAALILPSGHSNYPNCLNLSKTYSFFGFSKIALDRFYMNMICFPMKQVLVIALRQPMKKKKSFKNHTYTSVRLFGVICYGFSKTTQCICVNTF